MKNLILKSYHDEFCVIDNDSDFLNIRFKFGVIKSLSWKEDITDVEIPINETASCYPFFKKNKIVVLFNNQPEFAKPGNMVIFKGDGTIFKRLTPPCFIHPMSISFIEQHLKKNKISMDDVKPVFGGIYDLEKIDGKEYLHVIIDEEIIFKHTHFFEERALDITTGEWHPTWRKFSDPNAKQGWGEIYD